MDEYGEREWKRLKNSGCIRTLTDLRIFLGSNQLTFRGGPGIFNGA